MLSLVGNILTISAEPGTELTVTVDVGGVTATATVTADNSGLASLNLLTDLDIDFSWDQLLNAQVSVVGRDPAGNPSNTASIGVGTSIEQPVTIGNFGLDVSLNPLNPRFGFSGTTEPDSSVVIRVITPALNVELLPIQADSSGNFSLNLLSPTILTVGAEHHRHPQPRLADLVQPGVHRLNGNDSAAYGITLTPNGLSLNIGQIDVNGTSGDDVLSGANGSSEHINGGDGGDLIFNVGTGDHVVAGNGNDTIQITATDFVSIDGGAGFDTLVLANGIDLDYNAVGVGTLSNLERIDLGKGDSGSVLTLTAAEVDAITDANNTLQITGENNDTPERGGRGEYRYHATDQRHYLRRLHLRQYHPADRGQHGTGRGLMRGRRQYARKGRRHGKGPSGSFPGSADVRVGHAPRPGGQGRAGDPPEVRSAMAEADRAGTEVEMAKGVLPLRDDVRGRRSSTSARSSTISPRRRCCTTGVG